MTQQCESCRFWNQGDDLENLGECRFKPPVILEIVVKRLGNSGTGAIAAATNFPITHKATWCGEYTEKESTDVPS